MPDGGGVFVFVNAAGGGAGTEYRRTNEGIE